MAAEDIVHSVRIESALKSSADDFRFAFVIAAMNIPDAGSFNETFCLRCPVLHAGYTSCTGVDQQRSYLVGTLSIPKSAKLRDLRSGVAYAKCRMKSAVDSYVERVDLKDLAAAIR